MFKLILYVVLATSTTGESRHMEGVYETVNQCTEAGFAEQAKIKANEDPLARVAITCYNPKYSKKISPTE